MFNFAFCKAYAGDNTDVFLLTVWCSFEWLTSIIKKPPNINGAFPLLPFKLSASFEQPLIEFSHMHWRNCVNAAVWNEKEHTQSFSAQSLKVWHKHSSSTCNFLITMGYAYLG